MKVLVIGCGPIPSDSQAICSFGQLRTWSIWKYLASTHNDVDLLLLGLTNEAGLLPYSIDTVKQIQTRSEQVDVVVTAGPFLPALILDAIPQNIPLWLDWPSDPLADQHAKRSQVEQNQQEEALVQEIVQRALQRADAISVISERQKWATIGQLLLIGREDVPVVTIPIAFDFPGKIRVPRKKSKNVLLSGSLNTWLDIEKIMDSISTETDLHLHITGGVTENYPEMEEKFNSMLKNYSSQVTYHGWLEEVHLQKVVSSCYLATWLDLPGIEPLLGSRTRALYYIWNGLKIFGSTLTELGLQLHEHRFLAEWHQRSELPMVLEEAEKIDTSKAQQFCLKLFAPNKIYQPLIKWIINPKIVATGRPSFIATENQRLRGEIQRIYSSKTWRWSNRLHLLLRSTKSRLK
jgi:hypothetical protein